MSLIFIFFDLFLTIYLTKLLFCVLHFFFNLNNSNRFLTSSLGSRYLWKKLLTNRLKMALIHAQAVARGWLQYRRTIVRRALMLRAHHLAEQLNDIKKREIAAATILQTTVR